MLKLLSKEQMIIERCKLEAKKGKPLDRGLNVAIKQVTSNLMPCGYDVAKEAPNTLEETKNHFESTGRILVWSGASDKTIFGCAETNYAFRAWHDYRHITENAPFNFKGETITYIKQCEDIRTIYEGEQADFYCSVLFAEIIGEIRYRNKNGEFPAQQNAFIRAFLQVPDVAICHDFG